MKIIINERKQPIEKVIMKAMKKININKPIIYQYNILILILIISINNNNTIVIMKIISQS